MRAPIGPADPRLAPYVQSRANVVRFCVAAGFRGEGLVTAVAVAEAESTFDATATNYAAASGKWGPAVGLFQVRVLDNPTDASNSLDRQRDFDSMLDPINNAAFAYTLSKGGRDFRQWSAYTNDSYRKFVAKARVEALKAQPNLTGGAAAIRSVNPVTNEWIDQGDAPEVIVVGGGAHPGDLGNSVISSSIDFTMAEASLATFEVEDEDANLLRTSDVDEGSALTVLGDRHIVTTVGVKQGPASPHFVVTAQPAGVVRLRGVTPVAAAGSNAVDYVRGLARAAGLDFIGGPPTPNITITPAVLDPNSTAQSTANVLDPASKLTFATRTENAWEVARRLATEHPGYLCFEAAGTLYFATGDYLLKNGGSLYVQVGNAGFGASRTAAAIRSIGYPTITRSIKRDGQNRIYRHVDVSLDLPPGPGYLARPGQRLILAEPSGIAVKARPILVNQVTIAIGDETALVRVQAASYSAPGDVAGDPTSVAPGIAAGTGYRGSGTSQNGWPASPNGSAIGIKAFRIPGSSVTLQMADRAGPTLAYVAQKFHETVEPLNAGDCGGYNYRLIRGSSSTISNHGSGTAIDLNASKHGLARSGTFTGAQVAAIRVILAACNGTVRWGGDYRSRKDEMHFEINADPTVVSVRTKKTIVVPHGAGDPGR